MGQRESGELKILCQNTVEFKFQIRTGVERTGVERACDTKFAVFSRSPGGYVTQPGASYSEPFPLRTFYFAVPAIPPLFPLICASPRTSTR
jgi:hypothetical protein